MGSFIWLSCQIEENIFMQCLCFSLFLLSIPLQVVNDDDNLIISLWLYFPVERKARWSCSLSVFLFLSKITGPFCLLLSKSERRQNFNFQQGLWKEGTGLPGNVFVKVIWGWADTLSVTTATAQEGATKNNLEVWKAPVTTYVFLGIKARVLSDAEALNKALATSCPQTLEQMFTGCRKLCCREFWGSLGLQLKEQTLSMRREIKRQKKKRSSYEA